MNLSSRIGPCQYTNLSNSLPSFRCPAPKTKRKQAGQISLLKHDVELFYRLYIVMQHREGDIATFFKHENHPYPPSLSDRGKLQLGKTSDLLTILLEQVEVEEPLIRYHVKVLDGAAIVHFLPTTNATTFEDYHDATFIPHMNQNLHTCKRVDVVWHTYISNSIKESTRKKQGKGIRRKVESRNKLPSNWSNFLWDCMNKQELFAFLTNKMA